jgi:predicted O-linked N-acetylglucosamine transferase (SPINDLY family)
VAIKIKARGGPAEVQDWARQAVAHHQAGQLRQAEKLYRAIIQAQPGNFAAMHLLGALLHQYGKSDAAVSLLERAIRLKPDDPEMHSNLGAALIELKRHEDALASLDRAVALAPALAGAHSNRGLALSSLKRLEEAVASYRRALDLDPTNAEALDNLGLALFELGDQEAAIEAFRAALAIRPDRAAVHAHLGNALTAAKSYPEAIVAFEAALRHEPGHGYARAIRLFLKRQICDWSNHEEELRALVQVRGASSTDADLPSPFLFLSLVDDPRLQLERARAYSAQYRTAASAYRPGNPRAGSGRIRLAYLSPDFRRHPISRLIADLIELHDRDRFEVIGISYGPDDESDVRRRISGLFDSFEDVREVSDADVAQRMRALGVDIAVDLAGYTTHARAGILARRPAPIQVSYLGYTGTTGADWLDYVITDRFLTPESLEPDFTEKFAWLPDSFQVNGARPVADAIPSRAECGLPADGFVFCSFNNTYKIAPEFFDVWMRLLRGAPESVLWLYGQNPAVEDNLRREAEARGVDPARLVLAPLAPYPDHLARHRHADLFLDTAPYNAGATASDALWMGVPLLTCPGRSFASRMSGSLLTALGLPELIATDMRDYQARALRLAASPEELAVVRGKLAAGRERRLFNPRRFRRHLEAAYRRMWEAWRRGERPRSFAVEPVAN